MRLRNRANRYGAVAQAFHWTIAALIAVQCVLGLRAADLPVSLERLVLLARHKSIGMTILALTLLRLGWRLADPVPELPAGMPVMERRLARLTHWFLYVLLVTAPIAGWVSSSASNLSVSWFGLFTWPDLVAPDRALATAATAVHKGLVWLLLLVVAGHVLAALRHHFVLRDDVLRRMLPWPRRTGRRGR